MSENEPLDMDRVLVTKEGERITVRDFVKRAAERLRAAVRADYGEDLTDEECGQVLQTIADNMKKPPEEPGRLN